LPSPFAFPMDFISQAKRSDTPTGRRTNYRKWRDSSTKANSTAANSTFAAIQEEKRHRTLVLRNAAESEDAIPSRRQQADELRTKLILDALQVQVRPIAVFRLGKAAPNKPRFLMAELPTRSHLVEALRNGRLLMESAFKDIYVGKSMTTEERRKWSIQRKKRQQVSGQATQPPPSQPQPVPPPSTQLLTQTEILPPRAVAKPGTSSQGSTAPAGPSTKKEVTDEEFAEKVEYLKLLMKRNNIPIPPGCE
jgi:hypothetical protein